MRSLHLQMNYYNEFDPKTAAWLRELIKAGAIPDGHVDERSIVDVQPGDLKGYTQCHFFAGIGGWSYALQLAGWPSDRPVWSGSCPCQPFSTAGKGLAQADERHLWPVFFNLIKECRPKHVFGEQVASAIGKGWLDGVSADLESEGYACGATVLGAHSVGTPHIRQRLYWVADSSGERHNRIDSLLRQEEAGRHTGSFSKTSGCGEAGGMDDPRGNGTSERGIQAIKGGDREDDGLLGATGTPSVWTDSDPMQDNYGMANTMCCGQSGQRVLGQPSDSEAQEDRQVNRAVDASWSDFNFVACRDGKTRRVPTEPSFSPLAHGVPARVVRLRGYGNAIVPQCAAEFIAAFIETQLE